MKVRGDASLPAAPGRVWAALRDLAVLARAIPGCECLEDSGPHTYRITVTTGIASTKGTYAGEIAVLDRQEPTSFALEVTGAGNPGTVSTSVQVRLADAGDGSTQLSYDADAEVSGMIANVGQQMLSAVATRLADEFFASLDAVLTAEAGSHAADTGAGAVGLVGDRRPAVSSEGAGVGSADRPGVAAAQGPGAGTATQERRGAAGAAGVSFPPRATLTGVSGITTEPRTVPGQPAGRTAAGAPEDGRQAPTSEPGFLRGMITGAAVALGGVIVTRLVSRRKPRRDR